MMKTAFAQLFLFLTLFTVFSGRENAHAGELIQSSGDVLLALLPATAGISTLTLHDYEGTTQLVKSTALALGSTLLLKYTVDEERPTGGNHSFPSGHASISFSSAEFIRKRYGWDYGLPAYLAATFVGFSRVESEQHYFHDVLAGAALGIGSSYLFTAPSDSLNVSGEAGAGYVGLRIAGVW